MRMDIGNRQRETRLTRGISVADLEAHTVMPHGRIGTAGEGTGMPTLDALELRARVKHQHG